MIVKPSPLLYGKVKISLSFTPSFLAEMRMTWTKKIRMTRKTMRTPIRLLCRRVPPFQPLPRSLMMTNVTTKMRRRPEKRNCSISRPHLISTVAFEDLWPHANGTIARTTSEMKPRLGWVGVLSYFLVLRSFILWLPFVACSVIFIIIILYLLHFYILFFFGFHFCFFCWVLRIIMFLIVLVFKYLICDTC